MVLIVDDLLLGAFRFVLTRLADAVDSELNDDRVYREELLAAQMRLELGEITDEEFRVMEADLLAKIREVRERHGVSGPTTAEGYSVAGVEIESAVGETEGAETPAEAREGRPRSRR
jgi:gas vesicle protein GvpG